MQTVSHNVSKIFLFKSFLIKLQTYIYSSSVVYTIKSLILKAEWIKKGTDIRWSSMLGIQFLPKYFQCRYVDVFKRYQVSFWLIGFYFDWPRAFEVKNMEDPWHKI
jgi:hypothetical protein